MNISLILCLHTNVFSSLRKLTKMFAFRGSTEINSLDLIYDA